MPSAPEGPLCLLPPRVLCACYPRGSSVPATPEGLLPPMESQETKNPRRTARSFLPVNYGKTYICELRQPICSRERVCAAENMTRHIVRTVCTDLCTHTQRSGLKTQDSGPRTQDPEFRTHSSRLKAQDSEFSFLTTQDGEGVARPPGQEDTVRVSGIRNQESG